MLSSSVLRCYYYKDGLYFFLQLDFLPEKRQLRPPNFEFWLYCICTVIMSANVTNTSYSTYL